MRNIRSLTDKELIEKLKNGAELYSMYADKDLLFFI